MALAIAKESVVVIHPPSARLGVITGTTRILRVAAARGLPPLRHRPPTGAPLAGRVALLRDRKPFPIASPRAWPAAGEAGTSALT